MNPGSVSPTGSHHTLTNNLITIGVKNAGAELTSLRSERTGLEYLWQADPAFWGKHAPVLFPIVGALKDGRYTWQGKTYEMGQHGLARMMDFDCVGKGADRIQFRLGWTDETFRQYPFKFELLIRYLLKGGLLAVDYHIRNLDNAPMLFSIGAHPGFRCPLKEGESYEDYSIVFDKPQTLERFFLVDDTGLLEPVGEPFLENEQELPLTRDMFDRGAIVFKGLASNRVRLVNNGTGHGVALHAPGFPYYGIWAKPGADFVCLEPWFGIADHAITSGRFDGKEGIEMIAGKSEFRKSYSIIPT